MSEPRNVTPGAEPGTTTDEEFRRRYYAEREQGPEWQGWSWASRGRGFPWLGVLLVLLGVALLVRYLVPNVSVGTLLLLAFGLSLVIAWLLGGSLFAMAPGLLLLALGISELIEDLALFGPPGEDVRGLASASLAIAFVFIWLIAYVRGRRWNPALWLAGLFGLVAFFQLSGRLVGIPQLEFFWPVVLIVIGALLLLNARRR